MKKLILFLSLCASILFLASCSSKNNASSGVGSLTFSLQLKGAPGNKAKISLAPVDCSASGIATVEASVYDQTGNFLVSGGPWACNLHSGTIAGIPAGSNRKIIINTRDASGNILYSGDKPGLTITAGTTNSAGEITLTPFIYWSINTIDNAADFGRDSSVALDGNKKVHVAYYDVTNKDLKYITNASGAWAARTIDSAGDMGSYPSIAVDSTGKVHISYYDATNGDLKYATNTSGAWFVTTVDSANDVGQYSDIALDTTDKVHIAYYDSTNLDLRYATNESGPWVPLATDTVNNVGKYAAIAVGPTGNIHISYLDESNMDLKYATDTGGSWSRTALDQTGNVGEYSDIAVDSSDKVHISYFDANNEALKYTTNASGDWINITADTQTYEYFSTNALTWHYVGYRTSIAVDTSGKAHISYHERLHDRYGASSPQNYRWRLKYATNSSGTWIPYSIDSISESVYYPVPPSLGDTAIAVDSGKKVHITYYHMSGGDLKYATSASSSWSTNTIDMAANVGQHTSLAADSAGKAYIAFYDATNGNLKYMTNAAGAWATSAIESNGDTGQFASIALDAGKKAHISYYDVTRGILKYATNALASWATATVDSSANVGQFSSIALDNSGKVHVSYIDETNKNLKYATNASGAWISAIVDSAGNVGYHTDIAVDSGGKAYISYSDESGNLKYATNLTGSWIYATVETSTTTSGVQYQYTSIRIDSLGKAHISYYDVVNSDLKYATNAAGAWVTAAVDTLGDVGKFSSLALDGSGKVHVGYYDGTNADLRYATNQSGAWLVYTLDSGGDVGQYSSLAIDSLGNRHISYYNASNSDLKYATTAAGGGGPLSDQTAPAAPTGLTATTASTTQINLAWNAAIDNVGIAGYRIYRDGNLLSSTTGTTFSSTGLAAYTQYCFTISAYDASNNDSAGSTPVCATTYLFNEAAVQSATYSSYYDMALDSSGKAHISYQQSNLLMYATNAPGSWATTTIDSSSTGGGYYNSIAVDGSGKSRISYTNWSSPSMYLMYAAEAAPGSWAAPDIRDSVNAGNWFNSRIAADAGGYSHIVYTTVVDGWYTVKYMTDSLGSWSTNTIITMTASYPPAIAVDSANNVHIAYAQGSDLVYAMKPAGLVTWTTTTVDTATVSNYWFSSPEIALDAGNNVHISYYDGQWIDNAYHLKYATNASGSWVATTIDASNMGSSISVDQSNDTVHITYSGYSVSELKYATFPIGSAGAPTIYPIVNGSASRSPLKIDSNHKVHILTYDNSTGGLKYLTSP